MLAHAKRKLMNPQEKTRNPCGLRVSTVANDVSFETINRKLSFRLTGCAI